MELNKVEKEHSPPRRVNIIISKLFQIELYCLPKTIMSLAEIAFKNPTQQFPMMCDEIIYSTHFA